jgi:hypothetical protein
MNNNTANAKIIDPATGDRYIRGLRGELATSAGSTAKIRAFGNRVVKG